MKFRYTRLRGARVRDADGRLLGRLLDVSVRRRGDEAVCERLVVARNGLALLAARFGFAAALRSIDFADVATLERGEIRLRAKR